MAKPVAEYSKIFVLVVAGAIAAVFFDQVAQFSGLSSSLYTAMSGVLDRLNMGGQSARALTAVTRDMIVVGAVAVLCLAVSLGLFVIYTFSSADTAETILEPPEPDEAPR
jgi:L-asparagine transporter-like permease